MKPSSKLFIPQSIYMPKALGVKEYAFSEDMNESFRQKMEDGQIKIIFYFKISL